MKRSALIPLAALALLAACKKDEAPAPAPTPSATVAAPRTLVAADLDFATLGGKIEGPQGTEVETVLSAGSRQVGSMTSFVACPEGMAVCNPATAPAGTVYTYVHRVMLAEADVEATPTDLPGDGPEVLETQTTLFRTIDPAPGFNAAVGYDSAEAQAALGSPDAITITLDEGRLIWRVTTGEGWKPGTAITFWWQSTLPPKGPQPAYLLEIDGNQARATGPYPAAAEDKPAKPARAR